MNKIVHYSAKLTSIVLSIVILNSCGTTSTVITGSWERTGIEKKYNKLVVEAFTPQEEVEEALELQMMVKLQEKGISALRHKEPLPPGPVENDKDKEEVMDNMQENGADGILTISIIDKESESRYVPGPSPYAPYPRYPYYGSFWGYYDYWYPYFYGPGYYTLESVYYIETNLFDAESEDLIWSAQSKTYEHVNLETFSKDYAEEVVEEMMEDGIIAGKEE
ncbi:MAG: hypothetical protein ACOCWA_05105 [Bacteroidota bacterium]